MVEEQEEGRPSSIGQKKGAGQAESKRRGKEGGHTHTGSKQRGKEGGIEVGKPKKANACSDDFVFSLSLLGVSKKKAQSTLTAVNAFSGIRISLLGRANFVWSEKLLPTLL